MSVSSAEGGGWLRTVEVTMDRNVWLAVAPAVSIALGACLSCSSPADSLASTPPSFPFGGMPDSMGATGSAGVPTVDDASQPAPGGTQEGPPATSSEVLMPMDVTAPAIVPGATAAAPVRLCTTKATVRTPLIANFDGYNGTVEAAAFTFYFGSETPNSGVLAGLFAFDDMTGTSVRLGIVAGRTGGWAASHQMLQASAWGGGMGLWFDCVDASAFSGISFWVRGVTGAGTFSLTASFLPTTPPNATDARGGGTCAGDPALCLNPALDAIPLTLDWTLIEIPWASFTPGQIGGAPFVPTGDELTGLTFGLPIAWGADPSFVDNPNDMTDMPVFLPLPSDIVFQVDDINFMLP